MFYLYLFSVERGTDHLVLHIDEFEGEEGLLFVEEEAEKYFVALPEGEGGVVCVREERQVGLADPCEGSFVVDAHIGIAAPCCGGKEVHVLVRPGVGDEGDDAAIVPLGDSQPCLLSHLSQHALVGTFVGFAFAAHTDPLAVACIVLFLCAVQHEVAVAVVNIAEGCLFHD